MMFTAKYFEPFEGDFYHWFSLGTSRRSFWREGSLFLAIIEGIVGIGGGIGDFRSYIILFISLLHFGQCYAALALKKQLKLIPYIIFQSIALSTVLLALHSYHTT